MIKPWKLLSEKKLYTDPYREITKRVYEMPDGIHQDYYIKKEVPGVSILPITTEGKLIVAYEFRPGPEMVMFELCSGQIEDGESPEEAARRELLEEAGYEGEIEFVAKSFEDPYTTSSRFNYVCRNAVKKAEQKLDEGEYIETREISVAEFRKLLRTGQSIDIETGYLCLDYLGLL